MPTHFTHAFYLLTLLNLLIALGVALKDYALQMHQIIFVLYIKNAHIVNEFQKV